MLIQFILKDSKSGNMNLRPSTDAFCERGNISKTELKTYAYLQFKDRHYREFETLTKKFLAVAVDSQMRLESIRKRRGKNVFKRRPLND